MIDRAVFVSGLLALAKLYDKTLDETTIALYYAALGHLEHDWKRVCMRAVQSLKFFPRPSELLELVGDSTDAERAIIAWSEARRACSSAGVYRSVDFEDPVINAAIRGLGGWIRFCQLEGEEADVWGKKEFERQYLAFAKVLPAELARPLPGVIEVHNTGKFFAAPEPVRIPATSSIPRPQIVETPTAIAALSEGTGAR